MKIAQYYPAYRKADWILHAYVDEFVRLEAPLDQISELVERLSPVDAISLTSTPYSGNNRVEMRDEPVCDQFTMMSRVPSQDEFTAVKTLYRNALPWSPRRNHRPIMRDFSARGLVWKDGSGNQLPPLFSDTDKKVIASGGTIDLLAWIIARYEALRASSSMLTAAMLWKWHGSKSDTLTTTGNTTPRGLGAPPLCEAKRAGYLPISCVTQSFRNCTVRHLPGTERRRTKSWRLAMVIRPSALLASHRPRAITTVKLPKVRFRFLEEYTLLRALPQ